MAKLDRDDYKNLEDSFFNALKRWNKNGTGMSPSGNNQPGTPAPGGGIFDSLAGAATGLGRDLKTAGGNSIGLHTWQLHQLRYLLSHRSSSLTN